MRIILFVLAISTLGTRLSAQTVLLEWAKSIGGTYTDEASSIAKDTLGNIYVTGNFYGTVDFDPGPGTTNFTSPGGYDIFVLKLDAAGNLLWARRMGGMGGEEGEAIAVDDAGNAYITGYFQQTADFDPGAGVANLTSVGGVDIFVMKLDPDGNFAWARAMNGAGLTSEVGMGITVDAVGNAYVTGTFTETVDFDPGPGINNLTSVGQQDVFVMKMDTDGNMLWTKQIGGINLDFCQSVALDGMGNLYLTGAFFDTVDFDPGAGVYNMTAIGVEDIFVSKWDTDGNLVWAKQIGGTAGESGNAMALDKSGNIHIAGRYRGTVDFDPGPGTHILTSVGSFADIYVLKLDTYGNLLWVKGMGSTSNNVGNVGRAIDLDDMGNVYVTGLFSVTVDFDADAGIANLTSAGSEDIFILKLDASGIFLWVKRMGNVSGGEQGNSILVDTQNSVYVAGNFWAMADIGPGFGAASLVSNGAKDIFLLKLGQCMPVSIVDTQISCGPYLWIDGNTYSASNYTATHTWPGPASGCDTTTTLHLTINQATPSTITQTACSVYTHNGQTYTQSGTYTQTLTNAEGCDSTITLILGINQPTASTLIQTACGSYVLNGQTYTSTGTFTQNLTNAQGCDSVITLELTMNNVNTSVIQNGIHLQSGASEASYQWVDCTNGQAIAEATAQAYTATANGQYAVVVTQNGCTDTSACLTVDHVGISENNFGGSLKIYPNPTYGKFFVEFADVEPHMEIVLTSATGQMIEKRTFVETHVAELEINQAPGVYLIEISDGKGRKVVMSIQKN